MYIMDTSISIKLFGKQYAENDYIFKWDDGRPYAPDFVSQKFDKLLKQYSFPHIRFHELRHSCASVLISMGFSLKDIQESLTHPLVILSMTETSSKISLFSNERR